MPQPDQPIGQESVGREPVMLSVWAPDLTTEIFVIDGQFNRVARGLGSLEVPVPPGMYKIRYKSGNVLREVHQAVWPGKPVSVEAPRLAFESAAPLQGTSTSHEYQRDSAVEFSRKLHATLGTGSQLMVFVRDVDVGVSNDSAAAELTLHAQKGRRLIDLDKGDHCSDLKNEANWATCTLQLAPGSYRLRVGAGALGFLEQTVVTCRGWQTQVFLLRRAYPANDSSSNEPIYRADLQRASVLMARVEENFHPNQSGFNPYDRSFRLTELARIALENDRSVVSEETLRAAMQDKLAAEGIQRRLAGKNSAAAFEQADLLDYLLQGKYENPMLGIYGAHLLVRQGDQHELLRVVTSNLHRLIGDGHPDVRALDVWLGDGATFSAPPTLRSSWRILLEASTRQLDIVPVDSLCAQIGPALWGGGAWLVWRKDSLPKSWQMEKPIFLRGISSYIDVKPREPEPEGRNIDVLDWLRKPTVSLTTILDELQSTTLGKMSVSRLVDLLADRLPLSAVDHDLLSFLFERVRLLRTSDELVQTVRDWTRRIRFSISAAGLRFNFLGANEDFTAHTLVQALGVPYGTAVQSLAKVITYFQNTLAPSAPRLQSESAFEWLFDGTAASLLDWRFVGSGSFDLVENELQARPGDDFGILYFARKTFGNFRLTLEFRIQEAGDLSGVFVRFRDPQKPVPDALDPTVEHPYEKKQWVAVHTGFQVQIDELGRGEPSGLDEHRTGALYDIPPDKQHFQRPPALSLGEWQKLEVNVIGQRYQVRLNEMLTADFVNDDPWRGKPSDHNPDSGFIGLQCLLGAVVFRSVRITPQ